MSKLQNLVTCSFPLLFLIFLSFLSTSFGKSRAGPYQYRRIIPGSSSTPWRAYGGSYGGVLGGIGGEIGDLGLSYRSSRNVASSEPSSPSFPFYFHQSQAQPYLPVDPRSARESNYWNSYNSQSSYSCDYTCDDGTCLKKEYKCDGYAQCWDGSDEKSCTCREIIDDNKICDGYKDCPDGADEVGCVYGCQSTEFTCDTHNSGSRVKCVPLSKRCDGYNDCPQGNDEHNCFRMVDLFDDEQRGVRSSGILQKRLEDDKWHTVCKTGSSSHHVTQFAEKACQQIIGHVDGAIQVTTKSLSQMKLQMSKQQVQNLRYIRLAEIESKFAVLGHCASDLVYDVVCPSPQCGGHGNNESYRRRRDVLDLEDEEEVDDEEDADEELGLEEDDDIELIVGGYSTEEMQWPFLVGIFRDGEFYCGGSIINEEWIMTAAHCCHGYDKHVFEVQAGMTRRLSWSPYEQTREVDEIYVHEDYNSKIFANDIALYKLDKPLHLSKYVTPSCLPSSTGQDDPKGGEGCKVAGWGDLSESGSGPDHMQEVELPILSKCKESFTRDSHQICAGYTEGGKDACQGDSGGPLMCYNSAGKPIVNGVVSFGRGCARAHEAGAYTRVSAYLDWINKIVTGEKSQGAYYPRPKQCTEKCYKPGGECLYPDEKCSGKVDCLGAEDELSCTHPITRTHGDYSPASNPSNPTTNNYWPSSSSYPPPGGKVQQQNYYTPQGPPPAPPPQQQYQQHSYGVISRSRQSEPFTTYYPVFAPPPQLQIPPPQPIPAPPQQYLPNYHPFMTSRARQVHKVFGSCNSKSEFECKTEKNHLTECIQNVQQCDRLLHCTDHSDEIECLTVTTNFREPVSPSSLKQMKEVKGYVLTKYQGNKWLPVVTNTWTLSMGQQMCQALMGSDSAQLKSLETIKVHELSKIVEKQTGMNLMKGMAVKLAENANEQDEMESAAARLLSNDMKTFGHPGQLSKVNLNLDETQGDNEANVATLSENEMEEIMAGFVRCDMK